MDSTQSAQRPARRQRCTNAFHSCTGKFFGTLAYNFAIRPWTTVIIVLIIVGGLACGLFRLNVENRTEKLYIPQHSKAIQDLNKASYYFPSLNYRDELLLFEEKDGGNILSEECLRDILTVHQAVVELPMFSSLCLHRRGMIKSENGTKHCVMYNPLEIFNFDADSLVNITQTIKNAIRDKPLMQSDRPVAMTLPQIFSRMTEDPNGKISASAAQISYKMQVPVAENQERELLEFEMAFLRKVENLRAQLPRVKIFYTAERSLDDAISESTGQDVKFVSLTFTIMITFACTMLGRCDNPLMGHSLLARGGILAVALGILAGFGLAMAVGTPFISLAGVLPFLILGIGIDDMFIIINEMDRQDNSLSVVDTIKTVMANSGMTVTMTTVTDLVAFAVSTSTAFPSIRYFCIYASLAVTFSYIMTITLFVAMATFDVRRIKSNRRDFCPQRLAPPPKQGHPPWDQPIPGKASMVMKKYAQFLMRAPIRVVVVVISIAVLGVGIWGAMNISQRFDRKLLAKDNSYFKEFLTAQEKHFEIKLEVSIIVDKALDYETTLVQKEIQRISQISSSNEHYTNKSINWMRSFAEFVNKTNMDIKGKPNFMAGLQAFLNFPTFTHHRGDVVLAQDNNSIEASRVLCFMESSSNSIFQRDAMLTLRKDLDDYDAGLHSYPVSRFFIFFEQYAIIQSETIRNLVIASVTVLLITWSFLLSISVTILVFLGFSALIVELFALMAVWNVTLNTISMINLVMAIGFSVDYSAHIAHAFVTSSEPTAELRVVHALSTLGTSVLMGGISTFLGMVIIAASSSEIFRIFFRMFLGIVLFGLVHGLVFLPVYLSLFCRWDATPKVYSTKPKTQTGNKAPVLSYEQDVEMETANEQHTTECVTQAPVLSLEKNVQIEPSNGQNTNECVTVF